MYALHDPPDVHEENAHAYTERKRRSYSVMLGKCETKKEHGRAHLVNYFSGSTKDGCWKLDSQVVNVFMMS